MNFIVRELTRMKGHPDRQVPAAYVRVNTHIVGGSTSHIYLWVRSAEVKVCYCFSLHCGGSFHADTALADFFFFYIFLFCSVAARKLTFRSRWAAKISELGVEACSLCGQVWCLWALMKGQSCRVCWSHCAEVCSL